MNIGYSFCLDSFEKPTAVMIPWDKEGFASKHLFYPFMHSSSLAPHLLFIMCLFLIITIASISPNKAIVKFWFSVMILIWPLLKFLEGWHLEMDISHKNDFEGLEFVKH